jgi:hypothetical protein
VKDGVKLKSRQVQQKKDPAGIALAATAGNRATGRGFRVMFKIIPAGPYA